MVDSRIEKDYVCGYIYYVQLLKHHNYLCEWHTFFVSNINRLVSRPLCVLVFLCLCLASALATSRRNEGENIAEDKREKYSGYAERTISQAVVPWEMGQILAVCERSRDEPFINYENVYFIHVDFPHLWQQLHGLYIENTILMATTAAAAEK